MAHPELGAIEKGRVSPRPTKDAGTSRAPVESISLGASKVGSGQSKELTIHSELFGDSEWKDLAQLVRVSVDADITSSGGAVVYLGAYQSYGDTSAGFGELWVGILGTGFEKTALRDPLFLIERSGTYHLMSEANTGVVVCQDRMPVASDEHKSIPAGVLVMQRKGESAFPIRIGAPPTVTNVAKDASYVRFAPLDKGRDHVVGIVRNDRVVVFASGVFQAPSQSFVTDVFVPLLRSIHVSQK